jgi:hypothetical protein
MPRTVDATTTNDQTMTQDWASAWNRSSSPTIFWFSLVCAIRAPLLSHGLTSYLTMPSEGRCSIQDKVIEANNVQRSTIRGKIKSSYAFGRRHRTCLADILSYPALFDLCSLFRFGGILFLMSGSHKSWRLASYIDKKERSSKSIKTKSVHRKSVELE